jgi:DNA-binding winged helix-turn-helix (wHTH) protein/dienelactone hydrolase
LTANNSFVFRFAGFEVREREFCIFSAGAAVPIEPRAFRVLLLLLRNTQRVITKDEFLNSVWDDVEVSDNSLTHSIVKLRQSLGDDARSPRFIETVSKIGYRFICPVETSIAPPEIATASAHAEPPEAVEAEVLRPDSAAMPVRSQGGSRTILWKSISAVATLILVLVAAWLWQKHSREKWVRETAEPEIAKLIDAGDYPKAAALAKKASADLPGDLTVKNLWLRATGEVTIKSEPAGAEVDYRPYQSAANAWTPLGKTPLEKVRLPQDVYVFRLTLPGYAPLSFIGDPPGTMLVGAVDEFDLTVRMRAAASVPPEMVPVINGWETVNYPFPPGPEVEVKDFLIDRHEVTNEEFKRFVDAGGYNRREFWREPFLENGRAVPWEQAMARFHDTTGRPGPATWEAGSYPDGRARHPVAGVSWYEAMGYAVFAGKTLPTLYHWKSASEADGYTPQIAAGSNFHSTDTQPVGAQGTESGSGTVDMAGNVKEWCLNETANKKRIILGGGFGEPEYNFNFPDAQPAWERRPNFGFRCAKLDEPASAQSQRIIDVSVKDYWHVRPASDEVFRAYAGLYSYDKKPLNARVEDSQVTERSVRQRVTFDAGYGSERATAYLFLPRGALPPFQTIVYFPGAMALFEDQLKLSDMEDAYDFILKSGRAIIVPVFKGTYERRDGFDPSHQTPAQFRDHVIAWSKDLGRTVDYIESRKDLDAGRLAYIGFSLGGAEGPLLLAVDNRFKAALLLSGGFQMRNDPAEVDPVNFATHFRIPALMINGRYDYAFPLDASQRPMFKLLGTPEKDKKHIVYDGGHGAFPRPEAVRLSLDWFDRYLGAVQR